MIGPGPIGLCPYRRENLDTETGTQRKCHGRIGINLPQIKKLPEDNTSLGQTLPYHFQEEHDSPTPCSWVSRTTF